MIATPDDLREWLLAVRNGCPAYFIADISGPAGSERVAIPLQDLSTETIVKSMVAFVVPGTDLSQGRPPSDLGPKLLGWLQISGQRGFEPNRRTLRALQLSATCQAEGRGFGLRLLQKLKRVVKREFGLVYGVDGRNAVTGRASRYKDIGYSPEALRLLQEGWTWNGASERIVFEPVS